MNGYDGNEGRYGNANGIDFSSLASGKNSGGKPSQVSQKKEDWTDYDGNETFEDAVEFELNGYKKVVEGSKEAVNAKPVPVKAEKEVIEDVILEGSIVELGFVV
tara:strand:+ start:65 stop:376 length:312 start_codon:yes stop_codon:yes gene_type:complete